MRPPIAFGAAVFVIGLLQSAARGQSLDEVPAVMLNADGCSVLTQSTLPAELATSEISDTPELASVQYCGKGHFLFLMAKTGTSRTSSLALSEADCAAGVNAVSKRLKWDNTKGFRVIRATATWAPWELSFLHVESAPKTLSPVKSPLARLRLDGITADGKKSLQFSLAIAFGERHCYLAFVSNAQASTDEPSSKYFSDFDSLESKVPAGLGSIIRLPFPWIAGELNKPPLTSINVQGDSLELSAATFTPQADGVHFDGTITSKHVGAFVVSADFDRSMALLAFKAEAKRKGALPKRLALLITDYAAKKLITKHLWPFHRTAVGSLNQQGRSTPIVADTKWAQTSNRAVYYGVSWVIGAP